jgi:hypothetical protein
MAIVLTVLFIARVFKIKVSGLKQALTVTLLFNARNVACIFPVMIMIKQKKRISSVMSAERKCFKGVI